MTGFIKSKVKYFIYLAFVGSSAVLGIFKSGLFAKIISPEEFGLYSIVITTYVFIVYAGSFGLNEALLKMGSFAFGKGNKSETLRLRDISIAYATIFTIICSLIFILFLYVAIDKKHVRVTLSLASLLAILAIQYTILDSYLRLSQKILCFSFFLLLKSISSISIGYILASTLGASGLLIAESFSLLLLSMYLIFFGKEKFKFSNLKNSFITFKDMVKNGFPLLVSMIIRKASVSLDKWVISLSLGLVAVGKYSFLMILFLISMSFLGIMTNVLGPKWLADYGINNDRIKLFKSIGKISLLFTVSAIIIMVPLVIFLPDMLETFYPQYYDDETLTCFKLIYIGVVCMVSTQLFDWFFIATSHENYLLSVATIVLIITILMMIYGYFSKANLVSYCVFFLIARCLISFLYIRKIPCYLKAVQPT